MVGLSVVDKALSMPGNPCWVQEASDFALYWLFALGQLVQEYSAIVPWQILQTNQSISFTMTALCFGEFVFCFGDAYSLDKIDIISSLDGSPLHFTAISNLKKM